VSELPDPERLATLQVALRELAARFVDDVLALLLTPPEVPPPPPGPRLRRPSQRLAELEQAALHVVATLGPITTAALARAVGATPRALAHPLRRLLRAGLVEKWGDRRGARYGAPRPAPREPEGPPGATKAPKKPASTKPKRAKKKATSAKPKAPERSPKRRRR